MTEIKLPVAHRDLVRHLGKTSFSSRVDLWRTFQPYSDYEAHLRDLFDSHPSHSILKSPIAGLVEAFPSHSLQVNPRDVDTETPAQRGSYVFPLRRSQRPAANSPAVVPSLGDFNRNFDIFVGSLLDDIEWSNVVVAGPAAVLPLLPVPAHLSTKRDIRRYFNVTFAPDTTVDLFIYGLDEHAALDKIRHIGSCVEDAANVDVLAVRTADAVTFVGGHPNRNVRVHLKRFDSIAHVVASIDVDACAVAFDGSKVYAAPRALHALMTRCNVVNPTMASCGYEDRLHDFCKYGFEVMCPGLERARVGVFVYEQPFSTTSGLARLLMLERLPKKADRLAYLDEREVARGRRVEYRYSRPLDRPTGRPALSPTLQLQPDELKIKEEAIDLMWACADEPLMSEHHTFPIPYGQKYTVDHIRKLLQAQDELFNDDKYKELRDDVRLHRHASFSGTLSEVFGDCCGACPVGDSESERGLQHWYSKRFVSGKISMPRPCISTTGIPPEKFAFMWSSGALCSGRVDKFIVARELESMNMHMTFVLCNSGDRNVNGRDTFGRAALHLTALTCSESVTNLLLAFGAEDAATTADGWAPLHMAALRNNTGDGRMIDFLTKSITVPQLKPTGNRCRLPVRPRPGKVEIRTVTSPEDDDLVVVDRDAALNDALSAILLERGIRTHSETQQLDVKSTCGPLSLSASHVALVLGHDKVVAKLLQLQRFNVNEHVLVASRDERGLDGETVHRPTLPLTFATVLPSAQCATITDSLIKAGARSSGNDKDRVTIMHQFAAAGCTDGVLAILANTDAEARAAAVNAFAIQGTVVWSMTASTPLMAATLEGDINTVRVLLENGAHTDVRFEDFAQHLVKVDEHASVYGTAWNKTKLNAAMEAPLIAAIRSEYYDVAELLLDFGADANSYSSVTLDWKIKAESSDYQNVNMIPQLGETVLDVVDKALKRHEEWDLQQATNTLSVAVVPKDLPFGLSDVSSKPDSTFCQWRTKNCMSRSLEIHAKLAESARTVRDDEKEGWLRLKDAVDHGKEKLKTLQARLRSLGAKTFMELHPLHEQPPEEQESSWRTFRNNERDCRLGSEYVLPNLTQTLRSEYDRLFNAAWDGDAKLIKALCLREKEPLTILAKDSQTLTPLVIAVLRGHFECAVDILRIWKAQSPDSPFPTEATGDFSLALETLVDPSVSIESLRGLPQIMQNMRGSQQHPVFDLLDWETLRRFPLAGVAAEGDASGVEFPKKFHGPQLLTLDSFAVRIGAQTLFEWLLRLQKATLGNSRMASDTPFFVAIETGNIEALRHMIRHYGASLPTDILVAQSKETSAADSPETTPLRWALYYGNETAVDWFSTDEPLTLFQEWVDELQVYEGHTMDAETRGKLKQWIAVWLRSTDRDIFMEICYSEKASKSRHIIETAYRLNPDAIHSIDDLFGATPLLFACRYDSTLLAEFLLAKGADVYHRDKRGANVLHSFLSNKTHSLTPALMESFLNLFDETTLSVFTQQLMHSDLQYNHRTLSLTPLALYISSLKAPDADDPNDYTSTLRDDESESAIVSLLLSRTPLEILNTLDGNGDTPLHVLTRRALASLVQILLDKDPTLLLVENAHGQTPLELARMSVLQARLRSLPPHVPNLSQQVPQRPAWAAKRLNWQRNYPTPGYSRHRLLTEMDGPGYLKQQRETAELKQPCLAEKTLAVLEAAEARLDFGEGVMPGRQLVDPAVAQRVSARMAWGVVRRRVEGTERADGGAVREMEDALRETLVGGETVP